MSVNRPYTIVEYDTSWVVRFEHIHSMISPIWSNALAIEHIGSTSIPGMNAKPVIDILIIVDGMEPFEEQKIKMKNLGYKWRDNYIEPDSINFYKEESDFRKTENIHVCVKGSGRAKRFICMRDYLRSHPESVQHYRELKNQIVRVHPKDYPAYRESKKLFLDEVEILSYLWCGVFKD